MHVKCCEGTIYEEDLKHTGEKAFMRLWCLNWDVKEGDAIPDRGNIILKCLLQELREIQHH